jgi:hypothetical protein
MTVTKLWVMLGNWIYWTLIQWLNHGFCLVIRFIRHWFLLSTNDYTVYKYSQWFMVCYTTLAWSLAGSVITNMLLGCGFSHHRLSLQCSSITYSLCWLPGSLYIRVTRHPVFEGGVPLSQKEQNGTSIIPIFQQSCFVYSWCWFFIMAYKQQFELSCLEWKSPSYFNKPSYVLLLALFWSAKLNSSNNKAFYVSTVTERMLLDAIKLFHLNVSELRNMQV